MLSNGGHVLLEPLLAPALRGADVTPTHGGFGDPGLEDELERWCEDRLREIEVEERNGASTRAMSKAASAPVNWKAGRLGGGKAQLGIQAQQEEVVEEEEEGLPLVKGLVLSAWRAYGRVKQAGLVKELYLHFKGREHPYPFCAWQVRDTGCGGRGGCMDVFMILDAEGLKEAPYSTSPHARSFRPLTSSPLFPPFFPVPCRRWSSTRAC